MGWNIAGSLPTMLNKAKENITAHLIPLLHIKDIPVRVRQLGPLNAPMFSQAVLGTLSEYSYDF